MADVVKAIAYSSSANLGPGYDLLAVAHNAFFDTVTAAITCEGEAKVELSTQREMTIDPEKNTAGLSVLHLLKDEELKLCVKLTLSKGIPVGLGLGSSGASAVAAVSAVNELLGVGIPHEKLTYYAMMGEKAAANVPHPDNVAASMFGNFTVVYSVNPIKVFTISPPKDLRILLVIPDIHIEQKTKRAREMVPKSISMEEHVELSRRLSSLLVGLQLGSKEMIREGMHDPVVEVSRLSLFPFYPSMKRRLLEGGAISVAISGAGPTVFGLTDDSTNSEYIRRFVANECSNFNIHCTVVNADFAKGTKIENRK
ncbi:homoserine kinase [Sulfolobales archaeon HS-7]|nr:homoserine kinase [Sulfolobales archaeon HS-7]